jgi:2-oxo-3-hexenedioate decarboxylase
VDDQVIGIRVGSGTEPGVARVTAAMARLPADRIPAGTVIAPQIAFVLGSRLSGLGITAGTALAAADLVFGAVCAEDGSFYLSSRGVRPEVVDLSLEACLVEVDGRVHDSATGSAGPAGHPAAALASAANELAGHGQGLEPGWIVLTGPLLIPVPVKPGMAVATHFTTLGSVYLAV